MEQRFRMRMGTRQLGQMGTRRLGRLGWSLVRSQRGRMGQLGRWRFRLGKGRGQMGSPSQLVQFRQEERELEQRCCTLAC